MIGPVIAGLSLIATSGIPGASGTIELLVDLVDSTDAADERALEAKLEGRDLRLNSIHSEDERFFLVHVPKTEVARILRLLRADARVEHAEINQVLSLDDPAPMPVIRPSPVEPLKGPEPNDPLWSKQWSFRMVHAPEAWVRADGSGVVVAVIDTGVAFENYKMFRKVEDLAKTEFVVGYNFVSDTEHPNDDHGHGTHVAGTIAQNTNNRLGVAGLAPAARIMPLKVLSASGQGTVADISDAIRFAADEGAHIINMSLGGGFPSFVMQSAVSYARKKGVVVVCAAGNGGRRKVEYPAAYPGAFAVSSVGPTGALAFYSSWGKQLAVAAPGGDKRIGGDDGAILQNTIEPGRVGSTDLYRAYQGTSMAAPHVAGTAALVMSAGVTATSEVEAILKETTQDAGPAGWDERYGHGIIDAAAAVNAAQNRKSGPIHLGAGLLASLFFLVVNRRRLPALRLAGFVTAGAVIGASGLYFLSGILTSIPGLALATRAMPTWDLALFGASGHFSAPWASVLPVFALSIVFLGVRRVRPLLMGLALGWCVHLGLSAGFSSTDVLGIPGVAGVLDSAWLMLQAALLLGLAMLLARVEAHRRG